MSPSPHCLCVFLSLCRCASPKRRPDSKRKTWTVATTSPREKSKKFTPPRSEKFPPKRKKSYRAAAESKLGVQVAKESDRDLSQCSWRICDDGRCPPGPSGCPGPRIGPPGPGRRAFLTLSVESVARRTPSRISPSTATGRWRATRPRPPGAGRGQTR